MSTSPMNISPLDKSNDMEIMENMKKNHHRSKSIDLQTLNKTFSEMNVQSNKRPEKSSIEKINEIIRGSEKYYIPDKPVLKINTKTSARKSFKTPASEVDFNELLKNLDDLTSEVKNHNNKNNNEANNSKNTLEKVEKNNEEKVEEKVEEKIEEKVEEKVDDKKSDPLGLYKIN